jgi:hypothetical protein
MLQRSRQLQGHWPNPRIASCKLFSNDCVGFCVVVSVSADVTDVPYEAEAAVRLIAPRASSVRDEQSWSLINKSKQQVKLEDVTDQPLTLLLMRLVLEKNVVEAHKTEFQWLTKDPKLADLALDFKPVSASLVSFLQPSYISKVTTEVAKDTASGQIAFEAKDVYRVIVEYTAQRRNGKWAIVEFRLPTHKLKTSLNEKGLWKIDRHGADTPNRRRGGSPQAQISAHLHLAEQLGVSTTITFVSSAASLELAFEVAREFDLKPTMPKLM